MKSSIVAVVLAFSLSGPALSRAWPQTENATETESGPKDKKDTKRVITICGSTKLNVKQWPLLGKPDARYVFAEMYDYTCPHCRSLHKSIEATFKKYGDDVAIIALPVPLNASCNNQVGSTEPQHRDACELARLAIAVWRVKPKKFHEYHNWLFEKTRSVSDARKQAIKIVPEKELDKELKKKTPDKYLARHVKLYEIAGGGSIPKCLFPGVILTGDVGSSQLIRTIEQQLGDR
jgi:protein-disulfide isomerase